MSLLSVNPSTSAERLLSLTTQLCFIVSAHRADNIYGIEWKHYSVDKLPDVLYCRLIKKNRITQNIIICGKIWFWFCYKSSIDMCFHLNNKAVFGNSGYDVLILIYLNIFILQISRHVIRLVAFKTIKHETCYIITTGLSLILR